MIVTSPLRISKAESDVFVVTGASGFIARAVTAALARQGATVMAASRRGTNFDPPVKRVVVKRYAELQPPSADSVLIHLAEPRDIVNADRSSEAYIAERTVMLAELLAKGWGHVVYVSSSAVYGGDNPVPHSADEIVSPHGLYAQAKLACERQILAQGGAVARLSNVYGPGMAPDNVIADILRQIPGSGPIVVRDRKPVRDYLWVDDAADGLAMLALSRKPGIFNFGTGKGTSVEDLARLASAQAHESVRPVVSSAEIEYESCQVLSISDTIAKLGWKPRVSLDQGFANLVGAA